MSNVARRSPKVSPILRHSWCQEARKRERTAGKRRKTGAKRPRNSGLSGVGIPFAACARANRAEPLPAQPGRWWAHHICELFFAVRGFPSFRLKSAKARKCPALVELDARLPAVFFLEPARGARTGVHQDSACLRPARIENQRQAVLIQRVWICAALNDMLQSCGLRVSIRVSETDSSSANRESISILRIEARRLARLGVWASSRPVPWHWDRLRPQASAARSRRDLGRMRRRVATDHCHRQHSRRHRA